MSVAENPIEQEMQRIMPALCRQIGVNSDGLASCLVNAVENATALLSTKMDHNNVEVLAAVKSVRASLSQTFLEVARSLDDSPQESPPNIQGNVGVKDKNSGASSDHGSIGKETAEEASPTDEMPLFDYIISCSVATVPDVLTEWEVGFNGKPSVTEVEAR
jgi:hypothetical protein